MEIADAADLTIDWTIRRQAKNDMPQTIVCSNCGIALNLPSAAAPGKRLKCPKCGHRFVISEVDARSASTAPGLADAAQTSLGDMPTDLPPLPDEMPAPRAEKDLRETFDLSSLGARDDPGLLPDLAPDKPIGDVSALLAPETAPKRRKSSAEARSQARRCTSCQGFVPAGMSVCQVCGLDQETGVRVDLDEDLGPKAPPPIPGPPLHIIIVGGICGVGAAILILIALVMSLRQETDVLQYGWLCLALVAGFGAFASYEFVRGKSVKMLLLALTLGVFVNIAGMIVLPIYEAHYVEETREANPTQTKATAEIPDGDDDDVDISLRSTVERIDPHMNQIYTGLTFVAFYVILSVYLMSPPVRRYMNRRHLERSPIPLS